MKKIILRLLLQIVILFVPLVAFSQNKTVCLSAEENKLYELIMQYRKTKNLPIIPLSASLTFVAQTHCKDLNENPPKEPCNMHSWSNKGKWKPCCYTPDHKNAAAMWSKPSELTNYKGNGYEISHWSSAGANAQESLNGWKRSNGHNTVIINAGIWNSKWNAIGIGIVDNYAVVWFGNETDTETTPSVCK
jgi:uncharacterized protein YkwD